MTRHEIPNRLRRQLGAILGLSLVAHIVFLALGQSVLADWRWPHDAVHASVEMAGALAALWCGWMLVWLERRGAGTSYNIPIAGAMVGMGLLDGLHALCHAGNNFVWLHSTATFAGGLLFALMMVKRWWSPGEWWPAAVAAAVCLLGGVSLAAPEMVPAMVSSGRFTDAAMALNVIGGGLMFAAAGQLAWTYYKHSNDDDFLFCIHCVLFGLAAVMFEQSSLWDLPWWGWHLLRLAAYGVAVAFIVLNNPERNLRQINEELRRHKESLEQTVEAQTADIRAKADAERLASEQLRALINGAHDHAMITIDLGGAIASWNPAAERLTGYTESEALGMHFSRLYTKKARQHDAPEAEIAKVLAGESFEDEGWRVRRDGTKFWANVVVTPLRDSEGRVNGSAKIMRDLTERRRLEERFRLSVEAAPMAIVMVDPTGAIAMVNRETERLFGYGRDELVGERVEMLIPTRFRGGHIRLVEGFFANPSKQRMGVGRVIYGRHKDGREIAIETGLTPVETDEGLFAIAAIVDVTEVQTARAAARESENRFRTIADCSPISMWVCDEQSECVWLNRQWLHYAGQELESQIGKGWLDIVHPDDRERTAQTYLKAFEQRELFTLDYRLRRSDGEYRWHAATGTPRFGENGGFYGYVGLSVDNHDARLARQELELLNKRLQNTLAVHRTIIDESNNFIGVVNPDGTLVDGNRTAFTASGVDASRVLGKPFWETPWWEHSVELQGRLRQAIDTALAGRRDRFEATHIGPEGEPIYVDFSLHPVKDDSGKVIYLIPEGRDITQHKRREAELNSLLSELDNSNKELEQFAYIASHDLQEPLRKIASYGELLREEHGSQLNDEGKQYLQVVMNGATRLQTLVKDLLSFSRITTRGAPLKPTSAEDCLSAVLSDLEVTIAENQATVTREPLPVVMADGSQLARLFQNLVGNGIKYRGDASPQIHIGGEQREGYYEFFIRDNGIGIDEEYYERIFRIFQRLHNRREYGGTGIGLALCKRIVERFGGRIWVESNPGTGSTFFFTIPLAPEDPTKNGGPRASGSPRELVGVGSSD